MIVSTILTPDVVNRTVDNKETFFLQNYFSTHKAGMKQLNYLYHIQYTVINS